MYAPFKSLMIDLLAKAQCPVPGMRDDDYLHGDIEWYQYPVVHGHAGFVSLKLAGGITLHQSRIRLDSLNHTEKFVDYSRATIDFTEPVLQVHCTLSGTAKRRDMIGGHEFLINEQRAYVGVSTCARFIVAVDRECQTESVHLVIGISTLCELLGVDAATELCCRIQNSAAVTHDLGRSILSPLRYCLDEDLPFSVRKLRAHARILEFLSGLAMYFLSRKVQRSAEPISATMLSKYIRQHYRECVTLDDLAQAFGVSARTINNIMVRETGLPAARFMREQRLSLAHEMIQQTDLPLAQLADRLGYRHLSNFSSAFKKLFGYAPNVLRRSEQTHRKVSLGQIHIPGFNAGR